MLRLKSHAYLTALLLAPADVILLSPSQSVVPVRIPRVNRARPPHTVDFMTLRGQLYAFSHLAFDVETFCSVLPYCHRKRCYPLQ